MKPLLTLFLICLVSANVCTQDDYITYHNLVNQANRNWYEKDYRKSLAQYQEAFSLVGYVHSINYAKAARVAAKLEVYELTSSYFREALKRGYPSGYLEGKVFKKFRKTAEYRALISATKSIDGQLRGTFNEAYQRQIDSLHFIDQRIIRGNEAVTGFDLDQGLVYNDSLNFACLLRLIDTYGFPSEQNVGFMGYRKSWVLIHHSARLPQNHYYHPTLLAYVKSGAYMPENYCWVIDQGREVLDEGLIYYHWDVAKDVDKLSEQEKATINQNRKSVGMPEIDRIEVVKKPDGKVNKVKW